MKTMAYCAHPSIRDHWALRCMSRCPSQVVSQKRKPVLNSQARLVLIYRPTAVGMKNESTLPSPGIEPVPGSSCGVEA
ncbi:hypothetical protein TNCV_1527571 [Trichonephila clavipes]|nr:hypothetical protein TNCV_1527571 [Trichonephila clavipes]